MFMNAYYLVFEVEKHVGTHSTAINSIHLVLFLEHPQFSPAINSLQRGLTGPGLSTGST